ncbi:MAG: hypothetical protein EYC70_09865 [Planctomycetota bacterium]|nr:MAG: hypothetical protein EYC70_09865 [Planctomycetota bacterium]
MRVPAPQPLDFRVLADGVIRNNMGLGGIEVEAASEVRDGRVVFLPTNQSFPLRGPAPAETGAARRRWRVLEPFHPPQTALAGADS